MKFYKVLVVTMLYGSENMVSSVEDLSTFKGSTVEVHTIRKMMQTME